VRAPRANGDEATWDRPCPRSRGSPLFAPATPLCSLLLCCERTRARPSKVVHFAGRARAHALPSPSLPPPPVTQKESEFLPGD